MITLVVCTLLKYKASNFKESEGLIYCAIMADIIAMFLIAGVMIYKPKQPKEKSNERITIINHFHPNIRNVPES